MTIRVVLADDHPIVRSGIRAELSRHADIQVVGEALNGDDALCMARELAPDVLMLDVNMPGLRASKVLRELKSTQHSCKVLILTAYGDTMTIAGMLKAGANGYMLKDEDPSLIPEALRALSEGKGWYSPYTMSTIVSAVQDSEASLINSLTEREYDMLQHLAQGHTNKEISQAMNIAERTVEFHLRNIMKKLGVNSRLEAALWVGEHPYLTG